MVTALAGHDVKAHCSYGGRAEKELKSTLGRRVKHFNFRLLHNLVLFFFFMSALPWLTGEQCEIHFPFFAQAIFY